ARAALNPADDVSWRRVLGRPKRGIGGTTEQRLVAWADRKGVPFSEALRRAAEVVPGTPAVKRAAEFVELMDDLSRQTDEQPAAQFLAAVVDQTGYAAALRREGTHEAEARLENLDELVSAVTEWQEEHQGSL